MKSFAFNLLSNCAKLTGTIIAIGGIFASKAVAILQILPLDLQAYEYTQTLLSADGSTVVGQDPQNGNAYLLWSVSHPTRSVPIPKSGYFWHPAMFLNENGQVLAGPGLMKTVSGYGAWTWRVNSGLRDVFPSKGKTSYANIGVSPDGGFVIRQVGWLDPQSTIYRDYANGYSEVWLQLQGAHENYINGVTQDGMILFGSGYNSAVGANVPCYWNVAGQVSYFPATVPILHPETSFADAHGQRIVGVLDLAPSSSSQPDAAVFSWNTATGHVDQYIPPGWREAWPICLSPDGTILCLEGIPLNWNGRTAFLHAILDLSDANNAAKGFQDVGAWLENQLYISASDRRNASTYILVGVSSNDSTLIGNLTDTSGKTKSFRAVKLHAIPFPGGVGLP